MMLLDDSRDRLLREYGDYDWDRWKARALAVGLNESLAQLGRDLMREAIQHNWPKSLARECGWYDDGEAMLQLALRDPEAARRRWSMLLETDGDHWWLQFCS